MDNVSIEADMEDMYELNVNSDEMCRNCLARNCQLKSLFRCDIVDGEIWPLPKVYQSVTNIAIVESDSFPKNICTKCESMLFEAFAFKRKSAKSHKLLQKILNAFDDNDYIGQQVDTEPLTTQRKSQSTQTQPDYMGIDTISPTTNRNSSIQKYEIELECTESVEAEVVEEEEEEEEDDDDDDDEDWHLVCEPTGEIRDMAIDQNNDEEVDELEIVECVTEEDEFTSSPSYHIPLQNVMKCEHCGEEVAKRHIQSHAKRHSKLLPHILDSMNFFRCNRCQKVFLSVDHLFEHLSDETECETYVQLPHNEDDICTDYQYLNNDLPIRLLSASKNSGINTFSCGQCNLDFVDLTMFQLHFKDEYLSSINCTSEDLRVDLSHICGNCNNPFKTLRDTIQHMYFDQDEFECPDLECSQFFNSLAGLYGHFTSKHSDSKIECSHCSYVAIDKDDLKTHKRHTCKARNIRCDICDKTFYKKSTLNMHLRSHTNERKYPCTMCSKAFLQSNDLANHIRTHTLERPFKCYQCDKRFKTVGQRIGHMSTHSTENNFQCDICCKSFKSARILHGHKKIHGERQFNCEHCEKKFNRRYHLTLHMKRHEKLPTQKKKNTKN